MGAAATPPSPARAQAAPNTRVRTRATSAPRQSAISLFCDSADDESGPRLAQEEPDAYGDGQAEPDHEEPVARIEQAPQRQRALQVGRRIDAFRSRPVEDAQALLENQGEAEGEQELVDRRAPIDEAQGGGLDDRPERADHGRHEQERGPEPAGQHHRGVAEVGAQHVKHAVGEVDDAEDAEDQREPRGDEEEEPRERQRVEELFGEVGHSGRLDRPPTRNPPSDTSVSPSRRDRWRGSWGWGADTWDPSPPPPRSQAGPPGDRTCA